MGAEATRRAMRLLLDTHAFLWAVDEPEHLEVEALIEIESPDNEVFFSAASAWEISIKRALGKIEVPDDLPSVITGSGFASLPITVAHALLAGALPPHHKDPFDRLLVAQARIDQLTLVTSDWQLSPYDVPILKA